MANIIIAWECERDPIQIQQLQHLQKNLHEMGHQAFLIGASLPSVQTENRLPFFSAPRVAVPSFHKSRPVTKMGGFDDRLALLGFSEAKSLLSVVTAWDHLFSIIKPDLLISDCAPTASLAAYQVIPTIQMSDGLCLPPTHLKAFPRLRPDAPPLASSHHMLQNVQWVQKQRHQTIPFSLPSIFQGAYQFIYHLPEFDPYYHFRNHLTTFGTFLPLPQHQFSAEKTHFFAYLDKNYPDLEEILICLLESDKKGKFFIPGAPSSLKQFITQSGMHLYEEMPELDEALSQCTFAIHHGNSSIAQAALSAGIPQLTLPYHFDTDWISHVLMGLGVGETVYAAIAPLTILHKKVTKAMQLSEKINKHSLQEWASLRAEHLKQKNYPRIDQAIQNACHNLLLMPTHEVSSTKHATVVA